MFRRRHKNLNEVGGIILERCWFDGKKISEEITSLMEVISKDNLCTGIISCHFTLGFLGIIG